MIPAVQAAENACFVSGPDTPSSALVLTPEALAFVADLHRTFNATREAHLRRRAERQAEFDAGAVPDFLEDTRTVREAAWTVAPTPDDLQKRWVEITGPVDRKMMINAFNSGANVFMADFEDALSPTWLNVVEGQKNLIDAVRRTLAFDGGGGKTYALSRGDCHVVGAAPGLASDREARGGRRRARSRLACSISVSSLPQRQGAAQPRQRARTSIFPSWKVIWKRGSGMTCSTVHRTG